MLLLQLVEREQERVLERVLVLEWVLVLEQERVLVWVLERLQVQHRLLTVQALL